jgi:lipid-binding SYLF domain-containing protein
LARWLARDRGQSALSAGLVSQAQALALIFSVLVIGWIVLAGRWLNR